MKKTLFSVVSVLLLALGCAAPSHIVTGKVRPAIAVEGVKVFDAIPANYEIIGNLSCYDAAPLGTWQKGTDRCISSLKRDAAKLGANGIVIKDHFAGVGGVRLTATAIYVP